TTSTKYDGEFRDGYFNGAGTFYSPDGTMSADWKHTRPLNGKGFDANGKVSQLYRNGVQVLLFEDATYTGEQTNGVANGQGIMKFPGGGLYEGEFKEGLPHGQGTLTDSYWGDSYVGGWKNGLYDGKGTKTNDAAKCEGEFKEGMLHGKATCNFPDGGTYIGELKNDQYHGVAKYTSTRTRFDIKYLVKDSGEWKNGKGWNVTPSGSFRRLILNGVTRSPAARISTAFGYVYDSHSWTVAELVENNCKLVDTALGDNPALTLEEALQVTPPENHVDALFYRYECKPTVVPEPNPLFSEYTVNVEGMPFRLPLLLASVRAEGVQSNQAECLNKLAGLQELHGINPMSSNKQSWRYDLRGHNSIGYLAESVDASCTNGHLSLEYKFRIGQQD
ncbi:MAG: hypothetical protein VCB60_05560, partial [Alphaproteobacteria bacterium]